MVSGSKAQETNSPGIGIPEEQRQGGNGTVMAGQTVAQDQQQGNNQQREVNSPIPCTYASLVDPEEGTALSFIPLNEMNGRQCAKINKEDIQLEIDIGRILCYAEY